MQDKAKRREDQAAANRRTAWILVTVALAFLVGIVAKKFFIG